MNKKIFISVVLILAVAVGVGYSYYKFHKPIETKEVKDSVFSTFLQNKSDVFTESTDWYDTKITYPKDNQKVRDKIFTEWNGFATENKLKTFTNFDEAKKELQLNAEGSKYAFSADYTIAHSTTTISYIYQVYTFTGGAHGGTDIVPITYDEKLQEIPVEQIIPDDKLEIVSKYCYDDLLKQKKERLGTDAPIDTSWLLEGTKATRDNYSRAWYDGNDVVVSFGQYQVGAYVEGVYEVKVPKGLLTK